MARKLNTGITYTVNMIDDYQNRLSDEQKQSLLNIATNIILLQLFVHGTRIQKILLMNGCSMAIQEQLQEKSF